MPHLDLHPLSIDSQHELEEVIAVHAGGFKHRMKQARHLQKIRASSPHYESNTDLVSVLVGEKRRRATMPSTTTGYYPPVRRATTTKAPVDAFEAHLLYIESNTGRAGCEATCDRCFLTVPIHTLHMDNEGNLTGCQACDPR